MKQRLFYVFLLPMLLLTACTPEPKPIAYGKQNCAHCKMTISDQRYGAEAVTHKGKTFQYDSIECLASHLRDGGVDVEEVHSLWFTDFQKPGELVNAENVIFLHSANLRSPMGMNLTAFAQMTPETVLNAFAGEVLVWNQVMDLVASDSMEQVRPTSHNHR